MAFLQVLWKKDGYIRFIKVLNLNIFVVKLSVSFNSYSFFCKTEFHTYTQYIYV